VSYAGAWRGGEIEAEEGSATELGRVAGGEIPENISTSKRRGVTVCSLCGLLSV
jgi:hypothetical protein